ncbi:MAG: host attachment protein [Minicystis sp.]
MVERTTWILVCDASRARLFEEAGPGRDFSVIASFEHPESRERARDLMADANGRKPVGTSRSAAANARSSGFYGRPGVEPDTDPKEVEAQKFARSLAEELEKGFDAHQYTALVITAPPHFLGLLKEMIPEKVRRRLVLTLDKDLSLLPPRDIERRIRADRAA